MANTPKLALPYIATGQAQKELTHNDALSDLDALVQLRVLDRDLATPPASPADGAAYIVPSSPTGLWSGQAGKLAFYFSGWRFKTPLAGFRAYVVDEAIYVYYNGSAWVAALKVGGSVANNAPYFQAGEGMRSLAIGSSYDGGTLLGTSYIGFNAARTSTNLWTFTGDGTSNGGGMIDSAANGSLRFYCRATTSGSTANENDTTFSSMIRMTVTSAYTSLGGPAANDALRINYTASQINRFEVTGATTGNTPQIAVTGTDSNIDLMLLPKGTGRLRIDVNATNAVTTVGAAGAASALPATPTGYLRVIINGTSRKIPYYND